MIVKETSNYHVASEGPHRAKLIEIEDLGFVTTNFGGEEERKHRVRFTFWLDEKHPVTGEPFTVRCERNLSLHRDATLRADAQALLNRALTPDELKNGLDLDALLNRTCTVDIIHKEGRKGGTFANVADVSPDLRQAPAPLVRAVAPPPVRPAQPPDESLGEDAVPF